MVCISISWYWRIEICMRLLDANQLIYARFGRRLQLTPSVWSFSHRKSTDTELRPGIGRGSTASATRDHLCYIYHLSDAFTRLPTPFRNSEFYQHYPLDIVPPMTLEWVELVQTSDVRHFTVWGQHSFHRNHSGTPPQTKQNQSQKWAMKNVV